MFGNKLPISLDSGLVGSTDFLSSLPQGRGAARADDAQGIPIQSHIPPSILVDEDYGTLRSGAGSSNSLLLSSLELSDKKVHEP